MKQEELDELRNLEAKATKGPWFSFWVDDWMSMNAFGVSTASDMDDWDIEQRYGEIVALTLYQASRVADHAAHRWQEDSELIAAMRNALPKLLDTIDELQEERASLLTALDSTTRVPGI